MLELTQDGHIATLTIQRAEKKNAFTTAMWAQLLAACQQLLTEHAAGGGNAPRVLLLKGSGGVFCAGADIEEMSALRLDVAALADNNHTVSQAQQALAALPLPTIAVIEGPCFGGGFGLAAACDFRLASSGSQFAITPARLGLLYSIEDTRRVLALLGDSRTRRLLLRSERLDAVTALAWGAVDTVVPSAELASTAQAWASSLATQSPTSMAGIKATLALLGNAEGKTNGGNTTEASVRSAFNAAFIGPDFAEGATAFLAKRAPRFQAYQVPPG